MKLEWLIRRNQSGRALVHEARAHTGSGIEVLDRLKQKGLQVGCMAYMHGYGIVDRNCAVEVPGLGEECSQTLRIQSMRLAELRRHAIHPTHFVPHV